MNDTSRVMRPDETEANGVAEPRPTTDGFISM